MDHRSSPTLSRSSRPPCARTISCSWTTCAPTRSNGVAAAIHAVGAKLRYLPAYSPDLNPIEQAFSKLKSALRKGAARTVKALWKLVGKLIKTFAPEECAKYIHHSGYAA